MWCVLVPCLNDIRRFSLRSIARKVQSDSSSRPLSALLNKATVIGEHG